MRALGVIVAVVGLLVILGGAGMDTTETSTTCYESDYSWDAADSRGCVETTYSNPAPKMFAMMTGFAMLIGGGVLYSRGGSGGDWSILPEQRDEWPVPEGTDAESDASSGQRATSRGDESLIARLEERQREREED